MANTCVLIALLVFISIASIEAATEEDNKVIPYKELWRDSVQFKEKESSGFSRILLNPIRYQVIVGARDKLIRLDMKGLRKLEEAEWLASQQAIDQCLMKGQSEKDCHNYIRVLLEHENRLFTCGTHAFNPRCTWRKLDNLKDVLADMDGKAKCPYNPRSNVTSVMTSEGALYSASPADFQCKDSAIFRTGPSSNRLESNLPFLRTKQYDSKWLSEPQFVGSYDVGQFVYVFLRETAVEHINCGKRMLPRLARVCKNDVGGRILLKDNWTTFIKARLNCSIGGAFPHYYDLLQSVFYLKHQNTFYGVFTTPVNGIPGSAICAFNMSAIETAFNGQFKYQDNAGSAWGPQKGPHGPFQCERQSENAERESSSRKYQLMDEAVQPLQTKPTYKEDLKIYTHIVADVVATKHHSAMHLIFVATTDGEIKKLSILPRTGEACLLEILKPFEEGHNETINFIDILKESGVGASLYIGTEQRVIRIPVQRCSRFNTRERCIESMDPYCGWDISGNKCTTAPEQNPELSSWSQEAVRCPQLHIAVDGGWSDWSTWFTCSQQLTQNNAERESPAGCWCRQRLCNNPTPRSGGLPCSGNSIEVANCTIHGGWTEWSMWSSCSNSCGTAVRTRQRSCTNPQPKHGGYMCTGRDMEQEFCPNLAPCPAYSERLTWSGWMDWGLCSVGCGMGFRSRQRVCMRPANSDDRCPGCDKEYSLCNTHPCAETRKDSRWTKWLLVNESSDSSGRFEKRFKFSCASNVPEPSMLKVLPIISQERFCKNSGGCHGAANEEDEGNGWSEWTSWSHCTVHCGGGMQVRERTCMGIHCLGGAREERTCNTASCREAWSCWSEWGKCSVSCGAGTRSRSRRCMSSEVSPATNCSGPVMQLEACDAPPCEPLIGWQDWSEWSKCDTMGRQIRSRLCQTSSPGPGLCMGAKRQNRTCVTNIYKAPMRVHVAGIMENAGGITAGVLVGSCFACFFAGALMAALACSYHMKDKEDEEGGTTPQPTPSKPNHYTPIPLASVLKLANGGVKRDHRLPSDENGSQTATIHKRNNSSHAGNGKLSRELSADYSSDDVFSD